MVPGGTEKIDGFNSYLGSEINILCLVTAVGMMAKMGNSGRWGR